MLKGIAGKTAVVTGAAGGIGTEVCRRLLAEGANVVAVDLDEGALLKLAGDGDAALLPVAADVTDAEDTDRFFAAALDRFGSVDMFHANAGVEGDVAPVAELDISMVDRVFAVNCRGTFLMTQAAARAMIAAGKEIGRAHV